MNVTLWIVTGLLATVALFGGLSKSFLPKAKLAAAPGGQWVGDASIGLVRTLGVLEVLAAIGLILPAVVDIAPVMVPVTAVCWILLMIGAMITHLRHDRAAVFVTVNLVYLALAVVVAWGRFGAVPFTA